jgi:hypothetical protein
VAVAVGEGDGRGTGPGHRVKRGRRGEGVDAGGAAIARWLSGSGAILWRTGPRERGNVRRGHFGVDADTTLLIE